MYPMSVYHRTTLHLPVSMVKKIDKAAKLWGCNRNEAIISLLETVLAQDSQALSGLAKQSPDSGSVDSEEPASGFDPGGTPEA